MSSPDKWSRLSSVAEIISSAAVLLTLVYLAIQTSQLTEQNRQMAIQTEQNTAAIRANGRQDLLEIELDFLRLGMQYPELPATTRMSQLDFGTGMAPETRNRKILQTLILFKMREGSWEQFNNGILDPDTWEFYLSILTISLREDPIIRAVWENYEEAIDPKFFAMVNAAAAELER